jgi:anti-sigma regulatory factor (Ser/Thr protein kinase)
VECQRHEGLLNIAFADSFDFTLICPYDTTLLDDDVIGEARRRHPMLRRGTTSHASDAYLGAQELGKPVSEPLPDPPPECVVLAFSMGLLGEVRSAVRQEALDSGFSAIRVADAVTAVNELASNSIRHAGGSGTLRMWRTASSMVCQVSDEGHFDIPLVGRIRPTIGFPGGRGLWIVNQLCDLVLVRSSLSGTTVRIHMHRSKG